MKCICGRNIEPERVEYGLTVCKTCAFAGRGQKKYKGAMIFDHKTGGECQVMSGEDFAVLLWTDSAMTVGIADEYLNSEIDEFVANGIIERTPDLTEEATEEAVKEHAVNLFSTKLLDVFHKAVENVSDASRHNFEYTLDRLLDEGRLD